MIFKQWQQVLDGTKTQTRRPVKPNEYAIHVGPGYAELDVQAVLTKPRHAHKWVVGRTYAVQPGRGQKSKGRIRVKAIRRERLGDIRLADCLAEGIEMILAGPPLYICPICNSRYMFSHNAYACLWNCCGGRWEQEQNDDVWVLEFESGSGL